MAIDLHKHAVVEASAGTGKTYTIEQIVVRLLVEEKVGLDEILLVTFTEKATGELKGRVRDAVEKELNVVRLAKGEAEILRKLQTALDSFDQASIFTIHGFCQKILGEYAFQYGQDLRRELIYDGDLVDRALRDVQRRCWNEQFGEQLPKLLAVAQYNCDGADNWDDKVRFLARSYRPDLGHQLRPTTSAEALNLESRAAACGELWEKIKDCAGTLPGDLQTHVWLKGLARVSMNGNTRKKKLTKYLRPLLDWLVRPLSEDALGSFFQFHDSIKRNYNSVFAADGFGAFYDNVGDEQRKAIAVNCPGLAEAIQHLQEFHESGGCEAVVDQLAVWTIEQMRGAMAVVKADRGLASFDDMIVGVARLLGNGQPHSQAFAAALRQRFRYAIVDEFQDTDRLQWHIFKTIFLDGGTSRLIVVGDPKQAIFGFRGADLTAYTEAVRALQTDFAAVPYALTENWRSVDALLQPLNQLFHKENWFPAGDEIAYTPVAVPSTPQTVLLKDPTKRPPLTIVDVQQGRSSTAARRDFAAFVAQEIRRLLAAKVEFVMKGQKKTLEAGHISLLVFKRTEAEPLVKSLRAAGIPFSYYKQTGLWQSVEAEHLGLVLQALADPNDRAAFRKALLTSFFGLKPIDLVQCADIPESHPARTLFDKWLGFAEGRHWSALSQSVLEDSGILLRDLGSSPLDRRLSNLHHLLCAVEEAAYRDNLGLLDVLEFYESRRRGGFERDTDIQPVETEQNKVQIMTIHASKGLEFPIVFLAGGFTSGKAPLVAEYNHRQTGRVFDLSPDSHAKEIYKRDQAAEQRRLLYVALTRAMLKLYVPLAPTNQYAGCLATLLTPALNDAGLTKPGAAHAAVVSPLDDERATHSEQVPEKRRQKASEPPSNSFSGDLFLPLDSNLGARRLVVRSFSSLHRETTPIHFGEEAVRAEDDGSDRPQDPFRGAVFGEIVHLVLEKIDFAQVGAANSYAALLQPGSSLWSALEEPIERYLPMMRSRVPMEQQRLACSDAVARQVWSALRTPLPRLGGLLCDIPAADRVQELEFLFPRQAGEAPEEVAVEEGFFTGFMDLVFRKGGLYYLLDWKTNDLDGYDRPALDRAMAERDYHRQYCLYLCALERWAARRHGPHFNFLENFGGVYYLFLRGMTGAAESPGIFYHRPSLADLDLKRIEGGG